MRPRHNYFGSIGSTSLEYRSRHIKWWLVTYFPHSVMVDYCMHIYDNIGGILSEYHSVRLLGLNLNNRLDRMMHIYIVCKRMSRVSYLMYLRKLGGHEYLRVTFLHYLITYLLWVTQVETLRYSQRHSIDSKESAENHL